MATSHCWRQSRSDFGLGASVVIARAEESKESRDVRTREKTRLTSLTKQLLGEMALIYDAWTAGNQQFCR